MSDSEAGWIFIHMSRILNQGLLLAGLFQKWLEEAQMTTISNSLTGKSTRSRATADTFGHLQL